MEQTRKRSISIQDYALLILLVILVIGFGLMSPNFLKIANIRNILLQNAHIAVACMAVAILMISGGADLSVGNEIALGSVIGGLLMQEYGVPIWIAILVMITICTITSTFNMFMTQVLKGNTMIVTLATMTVYSGLAYIISGARSIHNLPRDFMFIGQGRILGSIPLSIIIASVLFIIVAIGISKTYMGKKLYAVGDSSEAARLAGINVRATQLGAFAIGGILIGICCVMLTARAGNATATTGSGIEFTGITACVLGGIPLKGGSGKLWKVIIAAYILGILSNGMQLIGLGSYAQYIAKGVVMMLSIGMSNHNFSHIVSRFRKIGA